VHCQEKAVQLPAETPKNADLVMRLARLNPNAVEDGNAVGSTALVGVPPTSVSTLTLWHTKG
jgi:hypothetical protein